MWEAICRQPTEASSTCKLTTRLTRMGLFKSRIPNTCSIPISSLGLRVRSSSSGCPPPSIKWPCLRVIARIAIWMEDGIGFHQIPLKSSVRPLMLKQGSFTTKKKTVKALKLMALLDSKPLMISRLLIQQTKQPSTLVTWQNLKLSYINPRSSLSTWQLKVSKACMTDILDLLHGKTLTAPTQSPRMFSIFYTIWNTGTGMVQQSSIIWLFPYL